MPFTIKDVDKHKKGLNSSQKKKWVKVANGVLDKCISDGGSDKSCAPKAIRIANSKFSEQGNNMTVNSKKIPKDVCSFSDIEGKFIFKEDEEGNPKFEMVGYSGKEIPKHFWWGNLAFDLNGFKFNKDSFPLLWNHDTYDMDNIMGHFTKPVIKDDLRLTQDEVTFIDSERANKFKELSKQGVPFQASIRGNPLKVEYVAEGESTEVNGFTLHGPGHVWRETEFKELSICLFGADSNTSSKAFQENEDTEYFVAQFMSHSIENDNQNQNSEEHMDWKSYVEKHPDEAKRFEERVLEDAEKKFSIKTTEYDRKLEDKDAKINEFSAKVEELEASVKEFEKREMKRAESEAKEFAEKTWNDELKEAGIPERLHVKIKAFVSAESHMGENGFDKEAFAAAVKKELEDWTEFATDESEPAIQGSGTMGKVKQEEFSDDEADKLADEMLGLVKVSSMDKE